MFVLASFSLASCTGGGVSDQNPGESGDVVGEPGGPGTGGGDHTGNDNASSRDLVSQAGFEVEGTMRQAWFSDGRFHDMIVVGILAEDWKMRRDALAEELGETTVIAFGDGRSVGSKWPPHRHETP